MTARIRRAKARKEWESEAEKKAWLESPAGRAWLDGKIAAKNARKAAEAGPAPEDLTRTRFPFVATIRAVSGRSYEVAMEGPALDAGDHGPLPGDPNTLRR